jgi:hypothetical protein
MNQFIYNEHGACENPILKTFKCSKGYEAQVEILIVQNELWGYGVRFNGLSEGWSHTFNQYRPDNNLYKTKREAFESGLDELVNQLKRRNEEQRYNRIIQILQDELCPVVENQLSLF